jgi:hypothetical protein
VLRSDMRLTGPVLVSDSASGGSGRPSLGPARPAALGWRRTLLGLTLLWVSWPGEAHAYLDPTTGSALLQIVVGGLMGGLFLVKRYWHRLKTRLTGRGRSGGEPVSPAPRSDGEPD